MQRLNMLENHLKFCQRCRQNQFQKIDRSFVETFFDLILKVCLLKTCLLRPFEFETNREKRQQDTGVEEVDFTVEDSKE